MILLFFHNVCSKNNWYIWLTTAPGVAAAFGGAGVAAFGFTTPARHPRSLRCRMRIFTSM
jgi:hypothetical protein